jgi:hypothetical protein
LNDSCSEAVVHVTKIQQLYPVLFLLSRWVLLKEGETAVKSSAGHLAQQQQDTPEAGASGRSGQHLHGQQQQQQQQSAGDILSTLQPAGSGSLPGSLPLASELEAMRAALRIRAGEVSSLEAQVKQLEMTRNR